MLETKQNKTFEKIEFNAQKTRFFDNKIFIRINIKKIRKSEKMAFKTIFLFRVFFSAFFSSRFFFYSGPDVLFTDLRIIMIMYIQILINGYLMVI